MSKKAKSYHDAGAMFGCNGYETWIEPALFEGPTASEPDAEPLEFGAAIGSEPVNPDQGEMF